MWCPSSIKSPQYCFLEGSNEDIDIYLFSHQGRVFSQLICALNNTSES